MTAQLHDLDHHRALVRASRGIPNGITPLSDSQQRALLRGDLIDWDAPQPADWLTPSPPPLVTGDRGITIRGLIIAAVFLAGAFLLGLTLIGIAATWRQLDALFRFLAL